MNEKPLETGNVCPNCGGDNEPDATFCQNCGAKLGSVLIGAAAPAEPIAENQLIAAKYLVKSLLWTAPTYNAYQVEAKDKPGAMHTVIEQPAASGADPTSAAAGVPEGEAPGKAFEHAAFENASSAFKRFGLVAPLERVAEGGRVYTVFEPIQGRPLAQLDQLSEKEAREVGLQLCALAEQFHRNGWVFNSFDPHTVLLDSERQVRLLGMDRARQAATPVADSPIYPSRGFTAPELFDPGALYTGRADVYSIGALLQFLLTGESFGPDLDAGLYPIATVIPNFERVVARAMADDASERFQSAGEFREALEGLHLPVTLQAGHFTDVGLVRELNEDAVLGLTLTQYYESMQTQIGLYIVSDGMGGEAAGEVASRVTVRAVAEWVTEKLISASLKSTREEKIAAPTQTGGLRLAIADGNEMATTEMLRMAVVHANREVMAYARANPNDRGLGATATVAMLAGEVLSIAHVGDSRCYLLSGDRLIQLTEDHSLVQKMVNTGNLSQADARMHPYRNVIYRSIGAEEHIEIDIIRRKLSTGDVIMLCSDGLNSMLSDDEIRDILMVNLDPTGAAKELVVAANAAGGEDNTSVIVVRLT